MSDLDARLAQRSQDGYSTSTVETVPTSVAHTPHGSIPNTPLVASAISFALGAAFTVGGSLFVFGGLRQLAFTSQLGFFIAAWATFHWAEFAVTAGWNREKCSVDSFLLNNGSMYHAANSFALFEYIAIAYFRPSWKALPWVTTLGCLCTIIGQCLRSMSMIHASTNFSHAVQYRKAASHQLVTEGVYSWSRHPSYAGFFYWCLGTQLVLQNPISFIVFAVVLWRFFYYRIRSEERALVNFFGEQYLEYRRRVPSRLPFMS